MSHDRRTAAMLMVAAGVIWGLVGPMIAKAGWDPTGVAFVRVATTAVVLWLILKSIGGWRVPRQSMFWIAALTIGLTNLMWGLSAARIPVGLAVLVFYINVPFAELLNVIVTRKPPGWRLCLCVVTAFLGLWLAVPWSGNANMLGVTFSVVAALAWAFGCRASKGLDRNEVLSAVVIGDALMLPLALPFLAGLPFPSRTECGWMIALGLASSLPFLVWARAVGRLRVSEGNLILMVEIPISFLAMWWWLGQLPTPLQTLGGALIAASAVVIIISPSTDKQETKME